MKTLIVSIITFVLATVVLVGAAGIDNVLAQQPRKSTFDNAIVNIAEAEPAPEEESEPQPAPKEFIQFLRSIN